MCERKGRQVVGGTISVKGRVAKEVPEPRLGFGRRVLPHGEDHPPPSPPADDHFLTWGKWSRWEWVHLPMGLYLVPLVTADVALQGAKRE